MKFIRVLGIFFAAVLFFGGISKEASANYFGYHYGYNGFYSGVPIGWGYWNWPAYSFYNPYYYTPAYYNNYGYSYYTYYRQPRYKSFGAITYSKDKKTFGIAWGNSSRDQAISESKGYCGDASCVPVVWVQGGCGAVAKDKASDFLGYAIASSRGVAEKKAMKACQELALPKPEAASEDKNAAAPEPRSCAPEAWFCTR